MIQVAVTTDRFDHAAPPLLEAGLGPVHLPCVLMEPVSEAGLSAARDAVAAGDVAIITSPRTVGLLWPHGEMPSLPVAAVGPHTAAAASAAGGQVVYTGWSGLHDLVEGAADHLVGRSVILAHGAGANPAGLMRLASLVPDFVEHVVYRMAPVAPGPTPVEAVLFASPSAVEGWLLSRSLDGLTVAAIGRTTAAAVAELRPVDVIATRPSFQVLAGELATYLEVRV